MISGSPVRPPSDFPPSPGGGGGAAGSQDVPEDETVDFQHVLHGTDQQPDRHEPQPFRSPKAMTQTQQEIHDLTHMPPDPGCSICRSTRAPNLSHTATNENARTIPLLVGDYCFLKSFTETTLATCLVLRLYPYKIFLACIVPRKGHHPDVVARVARFIRDMGLVHFAYKCDREASLNALVEEAISRTGRTGKRVYQDEPTEDPSQQIATEDDDDPNSEIASRPSMPTLIAVPELTHPGESATNGLAERSVRSIEEQSRTFLAAIEARIKMPIPSDHPILGWTVEHAANCLNHFLVGEDHQTPLSATSWKDLVQEAR